MANRPIGIFDSGVGGLTVLNSLQNAFPDESYIYFGDSENAPWGDKDPTQLEELTSRIINFLLEHHVKCIVIACNTTCSYFFEQIKSSLNIPVISLIEEACKDAFTTSINKRIAVMATAGTISQHQHLNIIKQHDINAEVLELSCPALVPFIENNQILEPECQLSLKNYIDNVTRYQADTLIYGCSHYPFLDESIRTLCKPSLHTINPAISIRHSMETCLKQVGYATNTIPSVDCYVSGSIEKFKLFMNHHCSIFHNTITHSSITHMAPVLETVKKR